MVFSHTALTCIASLPGTSCASLTGEEVEALNRQAVDGHTASQGGGVGLDRPPASPAAPTPLLQGSPAFPAALIHLLIIEGACKPPLDICPWNLVTIQRSYR